MTTGLAASAASPLFTGKLFVLEFEEMTAEGHVSRRSAGDRFFHVLTAACAISVLALMAGLFISLTHQAWPAFHRFGLRFLVDTSWDPVRQVFGAASSIYGTLVSSAIAMIIAVPLAMVIALFLVDLAPPTLGRVLATGIDLLATIPSIIYGMWGLFVLAPLMADYLQPPLQKVFGNLPLFSGPPMGIGMLTAGLVLAIMILPFICAVTRDVFSLVPASMKESAYGVGATTWEVVRGVTLRHGLRGIVGASALGLGRALGETMAITFVIGNEHNLSLSLFAPGNTISSTLANEFTEATDPLHLSSLMALALILLIISVLIQAATNAWIRRSLKAEGAS